MATYNEVTWAALQPILQDMTDRLARIERFLADSGLEVPASQPTPTPSGGVFDAVPSPGSGIPDYIVQLAMSGKTIQAIKEFRSFSGLGLKESKAIIEQVAIRGY
jgi:hypothetical protein